MIRDNKYLENLLYDLWEINFCDVARSNLVTIKYNYRAAILNNYACIHIGENQSTYK